MRHLIFAAALMTGLVLSGPGQAKTGNELYNRCKSDPDSAEYTVCLAYVIGVADTLIFFKSSLKSDTCYPSGVNYNQIIDIVKKWLNENPESRNLDATWLVTVAFREAWPCPKKKP